MTTYYDTTFSGLVPVKCISGRGTGVLVVRVTRTHGPYKCGERLSIDPHRYVYVVARRKYSTIVCPVRA
jgi:hypothetical protein